MITVTDIHTDQTATIDKADFVTTVTPWFPEAPAEVIEAIASVQDQLNRGEFITGSAIGSLGLEILSVSPSTHPGEAMSTVNVVVLDTPTAAKGVEWGLAVSDAPSLETDRVQQFLREHGACDNADTYALVVPDDLWSIELNGLPYLEVEIDAAEFAALLATIESES